MHDERATASDDLRHERLRNPSSVDVARGKLCFHVGEGNLNELDGARVSTGGLDGRHDGHVAGGAEAVDRDLLASEIGDARDARGSRGHYRIHVLAGFEARSVVGQDLDTQVTELRTDGTERLADGELDVSAQESGDCLRATLGGHNLDIEEVVFEDAGVDGGPQGSRFGNRQGGHRDAAHLLWLIGVGSWCGGGAGGEQHRRGGEYSDGDKPDFHETSFHSTLNVMQLT